MTKMDTLVVPPMVKESNAYRQKQQKHQAVDKLASELVDFEIDYSYCQGTIPCGHNVMVNLGNDGLPEGTDVKIKLFMSAAEIIYLCQKRDIPVPEHFYYMEDHPFWLFKPFEH